MTDFIPPPIAQDAPQPAPDGIHDHEIGALHHLQPHEHLAVMVGLRMVARGEEVTPNVAETCVLTLARLAGLSMPDGPPPPTVVAL